MYRLIIFGAGKYNYKRSALRLSRQARELHLFDEIIHYSERDLSIQYNNFWLTHKLLMENNKKYGFGIWKPFLILENMKTMNTGDVLIYLDAGCEINRFHREKLKKILDLTKKEKIIGTKSCFIENQATKNDVISFFKNIMTKNICETPQHSTEALSLYICKNVFTLVKEWHLLTCRYNLIDDTVTMQNNKYFKKHNNEQSIFSILTKYRNLFSNKSLCDCICISKNYSEESVFKDDMLNKNEKCYYINKDNCLEEAIILKVHCEDLQPYYTIKLKNKEKQTERERLIRKTFIT